MRRGQNQNTTRGAYGSFLGPVRQGVIAPLTISVHKVSKVTSLPTNMTQRELAEICGVSATRIRQLTADGHITRDKQGRYQAEAITQFIRYVRQIRGKKSSFYDLLQQEKYREKKRENDEAEKSLAPVEVIRQVVEKGVASVIAVLETLPSTVKRHLPEITSGQISLVEAAVAECRDALADVKVVVDDD